MLWAKFANFVVSFGQILKKYLAIWSHCLHTNFLCHTLAHQTDSIHCSISLSHTVLVRGLQQCYIAFSLSLSLSLSYFIPRHTHTCFVSHLQHTPTPTQSTIVYIYISLSHSLSLSLLGGYSLSHLLSLSWCTSPPSRRKSHEVSSTISNRHLRSFARSTSALRSAQPPTTKSVDTFL